jgi:two-component system, OmpR family, response regulator RegX3
VGAELRILVVGEDTRGVEAVLKAEGWVVTTATGAEALGCVRRDQADAVVVELGRYGRGLEVCATLRKHSRVPLMAVSRSNAEDDVVAGFRCGADALVAEEIGDRELIARLRALMRRVPRRARHVPVDVLVVGAVELNRATRQASVQGQLVALPRREFDILEMLMQNPDVVVTKVALRRQLWSLSPDSRTLDVQVRRLRSRLAAVEGGRRRIVTVRGVGYRFTSELVPAPPTGLENNLETDLEIDLTERTPPDPPSAEAVPASTT